MSGTRRKFTEVGEVTLIGAEDPSPPAAPAQPSAFTTANANILLLSLRALSQRTAMELARLGSIAFTGALVLAVWVLTARVLPDPTPPQLYALAGFAVFCLLIDVVRRRK